MEALKAIELICIAAKSCKKWKKQFDLLRKILKKNC